jgi:hypothetical protein
VPIAVAVDADLKLMGVADGKTARLAVFGSAEFADNPPRRDLLQPRPVSEHGRLAGGTVGPAVDPAALCASRVNYRARGTTIFYLSVLVLPELLLLIGLTVWWRRE